MPGEQSRRLDTCLVRYVIENTDVRSHRVGLRFMLDTFIGANDGVPFTIPGVGLLFAIIGLTLVGALTANLLGRSLISAGELIVARTPIVRNVYQGLKQIFASMLTASNKSASLPKVALIEFPSKGIWSLGFVTGEAAKEFKTKAQSGDLIGIFVAHGLLPPSGFTCFVPRKDVIPVKMSVEDAARIIISAGMASPQRPRSARRPQGERPAT